MLEVSAERATGAAGGAADRGAGAGLAGAGASVPSARARRAREVPGGWA